MLAALAFPLLVVVLARIAVAMTHDGPLPAWLTLSGWSVVSFASLAVGRSFEGSAADVFLILKFGLVHLPLVAFYIPQLRQDWPDAIRVGVPLLMALNLADAMVLDLVRGQWLNALTGLLLVLAMPQRARALEVPLVYRGMSIPVTWDLGRPWIIAFTLWDVAFVTGMSEGIYTFGIVFHLLLPLALSWHRPETYVAFRCVLLAVFLPIWYLAGLGLSDETRAWLLLDFEFDGYWLLQWSVAGLAFGCTLALWMRRPLDRLSE